MSAAKLELELHGQCSITSSLISKNRGIDSSLLQTCKVLDLQIMFKLFQKNGHFKIKIEEKPPEKHLILKNYGNLII